MTWSITSDRRQGTRLATALAVGLVALCSLAGALTGQADTGAAKLAGHWQLDAAKTAEQAPDAGKQSGSSAGGWGRPTIAVGGIPLPVPSSAAATPGIGGASPDPMILRANEVMITDDGEFILLDYGALGSERLQSGNIKGQKSRWDDRKLTTSYETTTRKVSQTWSVDRTGQLIVAVKLNPTHGRTQKYERIFRRVSP